MGTFERSRMVRCRSNRVASIAKALLTLERQR